MKNYKTVLKNNASAVVHAIDYLSREIRVDKVCHFFRINTQQYYRWKNKINCTASALNLCYRTHPHQLTIAERSSIEEVLHDPLNERKKKATIWYKSMRNSKLYCSLHTFYKYARLLFNNIKKRKSIKLKIVLNASRVFEFIHMDTTFLPTVKDGFVRAVIFKDNFCKKILHTGIVENGNSKWISLLLQEMFSICGLRYHPLPITLVSDGGPENKGEVLRWIDTFENVAVVKKIAKTKEFAFTNNEIESTFNIFKNEFLGDKEIMNKEEAKKLLDKFQLYNDNERYPIALYVLTPQEVFEGESPDKYRFTHDIQQAAKFRYLNNKSGKFCDVCSQR